MPQSLNTTGISPSALNAMLGISGLIMGLPVALFLLCFFPLPVQVMAVILGGLLLAHYLPQLRSWRVSLPQEKDLPIILAVTIAAVLSALLPGYGGTFMPTWDMPKYIMLFKDLLHSSWPAYHPAGEIPGLPYGSFLRYYSSYYLLPALIGKLLSLDDLNTVIIVVATVTYACLYGTVALYLRERGLSPWKISALVIAFLLFGDFDTLYAMARRGVAALSAHNELNFASRVEYFSVPSLTRWMPHCQMPALYCAVFFLTLLERRWTLAECAPVFLIAFAWSPFVAVGLAFMLLIYYCHILPPILPQHRRYRWIATLGIIGLIGLAMLVYYRLGSGDFPSGFDWPGVLPRAMLYNIAPLALLCFLCLPHYHRPLAFALLSVLLVLPMYYFGIYNDLGRYGSAPILMALKLWVLAQLRYSGIRPCIALVLILLCVGDGLNEFFYVTQIGVGENSPPFNMRTEMRTFDSCNWMFSFQRHRTIFNSQYYAPCQEDGFFSSICR